MIRLNVKNGDRFGKLSVIQELPILVLPSGQPNRVMLCQCDCGIQKKIRLNHLWHGKTVSCGNCVVSKKVNGKRIKSTKLCKVWRQMKTRCSDGNKQSKWYFDKGITVCDMWANNFEVFYDWAINNGYKEGLQIDRIDNSKGYSPDNCRFVDPIINVSNRDNTHIVTYKGKSMPFTLILRDKNLLPHYNAIRRRILRGWTPDRAIDTPIKKGNYKTCKKINSLTNNKL